MKQWAVKHNKCEQCNLDIYMHVGTGFCSRCYSKIRNIYNPKKYSPEEYQAKKKQKMEIFKKAYLKWKINNPLKFKASKKVYTAIRNKTLKKLPCFCGNEKSEAHHEDYEKPLEVIWLCKSHHIEADIERRARERLN